jgi:hypothetical protein
MSKPLAIGIKVNLVLQAVLGTTFLWLITVEGGHSEAVIVVAGMQTIFFIAGCATWFLIGLDKPSKVENVWAFSRLWLFLGIACCLPAAIVSGFMLVVLFRP